MGGTTVEYLALACVLNFTLIEMYKGKVCRTCRMPGFIHVDIPACTYFSNSVCALACVISWLIQSERLTDTELDEKLN